MGRHSGLMVSTLNPGESGPGSSADRGHCVVFFGKALRSHQVPLSLHPGVKMSTGKLYAEDNHAMDQHTIQGGVEILPVAPCYRKRDKPQPDGP